MFLLMVNKIINTILFYSGKIISYYYTIRVVLYYVVFYKTNMCAYIS